MCCRICFVCWNNHRHTESCKGGRERSSAPIIPFPSGSTLGDYNSARSGTDMGSRACACGSVHNCGFLWCPQAPRPAPHNPDRDLIHQHRVPLPSSASPHRWQILISGHLHGLQSLACFPYSFAFSRMYFKWNEAASDLLKCGFVLFFKLSKMSRDPTSCYVYRQSVFFTPEQWRLVWMSHGLFNHSRIWRHFGCFHILGITNEDAVDIHAQMCGHSSHFSGMNAQDRALWVYSKYVFTKYSFFLKKLPNSFPAWLYHCTFPPVRYGGLVSPHSHEPSVLMPVLLF